MGMSPGRLESGSRRQATLSKLVRSQPHQHRICVTVAGNTNDTMMVRKRSMMHVPARHHPEPRSY